MTTEQLLIDVIEWDVVNWSKALNFWKSKIDLSNKGLQCLELGGRSGGLSLWLALQGNNVICSDLKNPEAQASKIHNRYSDRGNIQYQAIDATQIPYENHFDVIIFKSILGGISRNGNTHLRKMVIDEIHKSLKVGGKLLFAENLEGSKAHKFLRKKLVSWGNSWNYLKVEDVNHLFENFGKIEYETAGFLGSLGKNEGQRNLLGRLDSIIFDKTVKNNMKYILFGVVTKI